MHQFFVEGMMVAYVGVPCVCLGWRRVSSGRSCAGPRRSPRRGPAPWGSLMMRQIRNCSPRAHRFYLRMGLSSLALA